MDLPLADAFDTAATNGLPLSLIPGSTNMPIRWYRLLFFTGIRKKSLKSGSCGVAKWVSAPTGLKVE
jgi:hypothetical protein